MIPCDVEGCLQVVTWRVTRVTDRAPEYVKLCDAHELEHRRAFPDQHRSTRIASTESVDLTQPSPVRIVYAGIDRRTRAQKRATVVRMLLDPANEDRTMREIARIAAVSHTFVNNVRRELTEKEQPQMPSQQDKVLADLKAHPRALAAEVRRRTGITDASKILSNLYNSGRLMRSVQRPFRYSLEPPKTSPPAAPPTQDVGKLEAKCSKLQARCDELEAWETTIKDFVADLESRNKAGAEENRALVAAAEKRGAEIGSLRDELAMYKKEFDAHVMFVAGICDHFGIMQPRAEEVEPLARVMKQIRGREGTADEKREEELLQLREICASQSDALKRHAILQPRHVESLQWLLAHPLVRLAPPGVSAGLRTALKGYTDV